MASKRKVTKKRGSREKITKIVHESTKEIKIDRALIENFVALQKVMTALSARFDSLSTQIGKLLELFEISAKALARKDMEAGISEPKDTKKILEKLDTLSQHAGLIGKGLALIHETNTRQYEEPLAKEIKFTSAPSDASTSAKLQKPLTGTTQAKKQNHPEQMGYQKSIAHSEDSTKKEVP